MYSFILASLAVIASRHISAQNLGDLPVCAQVAASSGIIQTGCAITDIACVCRGSQFLTALLEKECDETEQRGELSPMGYQTASSLAVVNELLISPIAATYAFASQLCAIAGVKLPTPITALAAADPITTATIAETVFSAKFTEPVPSSLSESPINTNPPARNSNVTTIVTNTTTSVLTSETIVSTSSLPSPTSVASSSIPITITATLTLAGTLNITSIPVVLSTIPPESLSIISALSSSIQSIVNISPSTTLAISTSTPPQLPSIITTAFKSPNFSSLPSISAPSNNRITTSSSSRTIFGTLIPSTRDNNTTNSTTPTNPSVQIFQPGSGASTLPGRTWTGYFAAGVSGGVVALFFCAL